MDSLWPFSFYRLQRSVEELQEGQRAILQELERLSAAAGLPARQIPMMHCAKCGTFYAPDLTGCPECGTAKPKLAAPVMIDAHAVDPTRRIAPSRS